MRNVFKALCGAIFTLCLCLGAASCDFGGSGPAGGGGGGGGGQVYIPEVDVRYDGDKGEVQIENLGEATVIVSLNGKEYTATEGRFLVSDYITLSGEYTIRVYVLFEGQTISEQSFTYLKESEHKGDCELVFNDENGMLIKRLFLEKGYQVTDADYPTLPTQVGVEYSWSRGAGFTLDGLVEIALRVVYTEYTIVYELNGGTMLGEDYATSYTVQNEVYLPPAAREGYLFAGWYETANFSGKQVAFVGGKGNTGNKTLYAKWSEITAEASELLTAMEASLQVTAVTVSFDGYEQAVELSSGAYAHSKTDERISYVVTGGYYYDYADKSRYAYTRKPKISDVIPLEGVYGNLSEITFEKNANGEKSFLVKLNGDNAAQLRIKVKDGKISYIGMKDGSEYYEISYTVKKISPKVEDFEEKKKIFVQLMLDGQKQDELEIFVKSGQNLSEMEEIDGLLKDQTMYHKGFFLDEEGTQPVTKTDEVELEVYFLYYSTEYLCKNTQVILRHTCGCAECDGESTDYKVSMAEYESYVQENFKTLEGHFKDLLDGFSTVIGDGYRLSGPYMRSDGKEGGDEFGKEEWMMPFEYYVIENTLRRALEKGQPYENLVIELRSKRESVATKKLTVHMDGQRIEKYFDVSSGTFTGDHFLYEYIPHGKVYLGWYHDEAMTNAAQGEIDLNETNEVFAKVENDTRKEITIHFGGVKGTFTFQVNYYAQGQHVGKEDRQEPAETQRVKFFKEEVLKALSCGNIGYMNDGSMNDYQVAGYFADEACTKPITAETTTDGLTDIYVKWGKVVSYVLHFVDGSTENGMAVEGSYLAPYVDDWWIQTRYTSEYRSVKKFYLDEGRKTETLTVVSGDVYVGYEAYPTLTLACPSECANGTHTFQLSTSYFDESWFYEEGLCGLHGFTIAGTEEFNKCEFYTDKDCTKPVYELNEDGQYYMQSDMTLYAKLALTARNLKVYCGCLTHGETGVSVTAYTETDLINQMKKLCDFGRYVEHYAFYKNAERKELLDWWNSEGVSTVWLQRFTPVKLQLEGEGEKTLLASTVREVVYFYEEEPVWSDGSTMDKWEDPALMPQWALFTDSSYSTPRILNEAYELTANESFYFKKITVSNGYYETVIDGGEYGTQAVGSSFGELVNSIVEVNDSLFAWSGKLVEGYYFDAACTEIAMKRGERYYLNQPITLYAKLIEMPTMTVHFMQDGYDNEQQINLPTLQSYYEYLWQYVNFEYLFEEGYTFELCRNADGSGVVNLGEIAKEGEYYFLKNEYSKNNIKITLPNAYATENYIYNGAQKIGYGDYFYLPKGASLQAVLKALHGSSVGVKLDNGQKFAVRDMIRENWEGENTQSTYSQVSIFKIYTNEGMTAQLTSSVALTADTALYLSLDVSGMKKTTVYLEEKGTFVFYRSDFGMPSDHELFYYLQGYQNEVPWNVYLDYPTLFEFGAICGIYTDREMTKLYGGYEEVSALYANLETLYTLYITNPTGGALIAYAGAEKKSISDYSPELLTNPRVYGIDKVGYFPYIASDEEGKNEVSLTEPLSGTYYVCYRRDPSKVEVTVGNYEGADFDPNCDFYLKSDGGAENGGEPPRLGTMSTFYLTKGASLEVFVQRLKEILTVWYDDGNGNLTAMLPEVKIYTDAARKQELADLTVEEDVTLYVTVIPWDGGF